MTETFEVGQKVKHAVYGDMEVTYGPFRARFAPVAYLARHEDGREMAATDRSLAAIPETPKFAVGDVVTLATRAGARVTVEYGPFDDRDVYVVKLVEAPDGDDNPRTFTAMAHVMTKVVEPEPVKVGDRVRVTDDDGGGSNRFNGRVGVLKEYNERNYLPYLVEFGDGRGYHGDENGRWNCKAVERVTDEDTYTHNGVTFDLAAQYSDKDDDVWCLKRINGVVRARLVEDREAPTSSSNPLAVVAERWGPLTRI